MDQPGKTLTLDVGRGTARDHETGAYNMLSIFVKAGAIIPMQPEMNYFGKKSVDPVTLDIYPSGYSTFKIYEADGKISVMLNKLSF